MKRKPPKPKTLHALFAKSKNECAFDVCKHEIVTDDNLVVGQICHIESPEKFGPRYNGRKSVDELREYGNLILLCYKHHKIIDTKTDVYTVKKLLEMKADHESSNLPDYDPPTSLISEVQKSLDSYFSKMQYISSARMKRLEVAVDFRADVPATQIGENLVSDLKRVSGIIELLPIQPGCEETTGITIPNSFIEMELSIRKLEIAYLSCIAGHSQDQSHKALLENRKMQLQKFVKSTCLSD